jgi:transcriptional regulator with XRE-family HTH domain
LAAFEMIYNYKEIGEIIRKKRMDLGRDIASMADETKISEKYLAAVEEGQIQEFPSLVYYSLFARSYAKELGLDSEKLFADEALPEEAPETFNNSSQSPSNGVEEKKIAYPSRKPTTKSFLWFLFIVVAAAAVIAIILIKGKTPQETSQAAPELPATAEETNGEENIPAFDTMALDSLADVLPVRGIRLNVIVKETCWMVVVADGDTVVFGNLDPGSSHDFKAINSFRLSAGNPGGLEMRLNDTLMKPLSSGNLPVKNILINKENAGSFYAIPKDSSHAGD